MTVTAVAVFGAQAKCLLCMEVSEGLRFDFYVTPKRAETLAICGNCLIRNLDGAFKVGMTNVWRNNLGSRRRSIEMKTGGAK